MRQELMYLIPSFLTLVAMVTSGDYSLKMENTYNFTHLKSKAFNLFQDKTAADYLLKWSMKGQLKAVTFCFNEPFQLYQKAVFAEGFFKDPNVINIICDLLPTWSYSKEKITKIRINDVFCTKLSMDFFDRILNPENRIVRSGGHIHHCADDFIDDFTISDELRKMVINEESDNYGLYNEKDRHEFLFLLFEHFVLGGKWCQFEDKIEPYLDMTKMAYKELVRVERNSETKNIEIRTLCFKVVVEGEHESLFPVNADHKQNFAYLLVDPVLRQVTLFAHEFGGQF